MRDLGCSVLAVAESLVERADGTLDIVNIIDRVVAAQFPAKVKRSSASLIAILWGDQSQREKCRLSIRHSECEDRNYHVFGQSMGAKEIKTFGLDLVGFPFPGLYSFEIIMDSTLLARCSLVVELHRSHFGMG